jgi:hypothetical protein
MVRPYAGPLLSSRTIGRQSIEGRVCDDPPFGSAAGIVDVHTHAIDPDLPTLAEHRGKSPQLVIERTDDVTARMLLAPRPVARWARTSTVAPISTP